jgi:hypothetical protein
MLGFFYQTRRAPSTMTFSEIPQKAGTSCSILAGRHRPVMEISAIVVGLICHINTKMAGSSIASVRTLPCCSIFAKSRAKNPLTRNLSPTTVGPNRQRRAAPFCGYGLGGQDDDAGTHDPDLQASYHDSPAGASPLPREAPTPDPRLTLSTREGHSACTAMRCPILQGGFPQARCEQTPEKLGSKASKRVASVPALWPSRLSGTVCGHADLRSYSIIDRR